MRLSAAPSSTHFAAPLICGMGDASPFSGPGRASGPVAPFSAPPPAHGLSSAPRASLRLSGPSIIQWQSPASTTARHVSLSGCAPSPRARTRRLACPALSPGAHLCERAGSFFFRASKPPVFAVQSPCREFRAERYTKCPKCPLRISSVTTSPRPSATKPAPLDIFSGILIPGSGSFS